MTPFDPLAGLDWGTKAPGHWITYFFVPAGETEDEEGRPLTAVEWNDYEKGQIRLALETFSQVTNLRFGEVPQDASGDPATSPMLVLTLTDLLNPSLLGSCTALGQAEAARGTFNVGGSTWSREAGGTLDAGGDAFQTLIHEFGHGLGLSHPHDAGMNGDSPVFPGVVDSQGQYGYGEYDLNQGVWTIMSYVPGWATGPNGLADTAAYGLTRTPMAFDIAVLQAKYGANMSWATGDDVYELTDVNATGTSYAAIWDAGGTDTLRYGGARNAVIDLTAATLRWEAGGAGWVSYVDGVYAGYTIAHGVVIENAAGGSGDDQIRGNAADNAIEGGLGNDILDGGAGRDVAVYTTTLARQSGEWGAGQGGYVLAGAEGRDLLRNFEEFRFTDGTVEQDDGNPLVDDLTYALANGDVWAAGVEAEVHYAARGWREGRDPNAFFSTRGYLAANRDVAEAGINPLEHHAQSGWQEGRASAANFDVRVYLERNADVKAAGVNPLEHYLAHGLAEGRASYDAVGTAIIGGFDATYYMLANPDVAVAGIDAMVHWKAAGAAEGRDPNGWFSTAFYAAANADVVQAGVNLLDQYMQWGWKEGRDAGPDFDTGRYLAANADVAAAGVNPLQHFLMNGSHEGRDAFAIA